MKKFLFAFILSFIFIFNVEAKQATSAFYLHGIPEMYIKSIKGDSSHIGKIYMIKRSSNSYVYCLDPFVMVNQSYFYNVYDYNDEYFNLTDEKLNKINLISYFGYEYENHTESKWYGITQLLIWRELVDNSYFVDGLSGNKIEIYEDEIDELNNLVNNYYKLPSFSENTFNYNTNSNYAVIDLNNVLNNYEIEYSNIESNIEDNKLYISTKEKGNYRVDFIRKSPIDRDYLLYGLENYQSVIYPGRVDDIRFSINISVDEESNNDVLIVEVPNTGVHNKYRVYPIFMISLGIFLVIKSCKKATHFE